MQLNETLKQRGKRYGSFAQVAQTVEKIKETITASPNWQFLTPAQKHSLEQITVKISRIINGDPYYKDNWVDIQGYAKLISDELGD